MFNSVYKRCNFNDANMWRDTGSGELHATFLESSPSGSHTLPLALPFAAQPVACQCPGTVNTVGAINLPKPTVTDQGATHRHAMTQPPSARTFPNQKAERSLRNHHVASILHAGGHHLQHRLSRASKPKSRYKPTRFVLLPGFEATWRAGKGPAPRSCASIRVGSVAGRRGRTDPDRLCASG